METKVLFLDIDGVLATDSSYGTNKFTIEDVTVPYSWDNECIKTLNDLYLELDFKIVISSDWRLHYNLDQIKSIFKHNNFHYDILDPIIGFTSQRFSKMSGYLEGNRKNEIEDWVYTHKVIKWCAVDDINLSPLKNFVHIKDTSLGINNPETIEQIKNYLK